MEDRELIAKIQSLKEIKPNNNWVVLTRRNIFANENEYANILKGFLVPSFVGVTAVLFAVFILVQNSLPGDLFYPVKRIAERSKAVMLVSENDRPMFALDITERRLEDINKAAASQTKKLASAISEFEKAEIEAKKEITKTVEEKGESAKELVERFVEVKEREKQVLGSLGLEPKDNQEYEQRFAEFLINDWQERTLTEDQEELLVKAKDLFENKEYSSALYLLTRPEIVEENIVIEEIEELEEIEEVIEEQLN